MQNKALVYQLFLWRLRYAAKILDISKVQTGIGRLSFHFSFFLTSFLLLSLLQFSWKKNLLAFSARIHFPDKFQLRIFHFYISSSNISGFDHLSCSTGCFMFVSLWIGICFILWIRNNSPDLERQKKLLLFLVLFDYLGFGSFFLVCLKEKTHLTFKVES